MNMVAEGQQTNERLVQQLKTVFRIKLGYGDSFVKSIRVDEDGVLHFDAPSGTSVRTVQEALGKNIDLTPENNHYAIAVSEIETAPSLEVKGVRTREMGAPESYRPTTAVWRG